MARKPSRLGTAPLVSNLHFSSLLLPQNLDQAECVDVFVSGQERELQTAGCRAYQGIKWVVIGPGFVCEIDLFWRQVQWLIGRVAEEVREKLSQRAAEISLAHSHQ
jgi:hypothetical protein